MPRWKLTLEYDGAGFSGWQRQDHIHSVQQTVEEAIHSFCGETVRLHVAGRTDAGVHAFAQVAHFDVTKEVEADRVRDALNFYMKHRPVSVLKAEPVSDEFHARFSALARHYVYRVVNRRAALALDVGRAYHVPRPLNVPAMQEAAKLLLGQHDFSTFRAAECQAKSPVKTLDRADITQDGEDIRFLFSARSFLYHQVRNMVGSLLHVGTGYWHVLDFKRSLDACDRTQGGPMAPAYALYFIRVDYD